MEPSLASPVARPARPTRRAQPIEDLWLAAPVFLFYHLGLLVSPGAANGVDPFTRGLGTLAGLSKPVYLLIVLLLIGGYLLAGRFLTRRNRLEPRRLGLLLLEAGLYAVLMGPVAGLLLSKLHVLGGGLAQMGPLDRLVASAGAGFYEELVFRLVGLGGLVWLLVHQGLRRWLAVALGLAVSSLVFSAVHYLGPGSDPFELASFAYRTVLGAFLGTIFLVRGFATAVWAHGLYDVYVMVILMS